MSYLENFLANYIEHIEDYDTLLYLLSLLAKPYQYKFLLNLLKYDDCLVEGDLLEGIIPVGIIRIRNDKIVLEHDDFTEVLLMLPDEWDV